MKKGFTVAVALVLAGLFTFGVYGQAHALRTAGSYEEENYVWSGHKRVYWFTFTGGEVASVAAVGDGDIDIRVYDAKGRLVDADTARDFEPVCVWYPSRTQVYRVEVVNATDYTVDYAFGAP